MADVVERVARLEERSDGMTGAMAELKIEIAELRSDLKGGFSEVRAEVGGLRAHMDNQFRWIMGGLGAATLAVLVAVLAAVLTKG